MDLKIQHFVIFITIVFFVSCKEAVPHLQKIDTKRLVVTDSLDANDSISAFIAPYKKRVNEVLDSALAYAPLAITKTDGVLNTSAGNLLADIVLQRGRPIFESRTGKNIDFTLLNHGGIRAIISSGKVSARTAYEVMPFENTIVVVGLKGKAVRDLISFVVREDRPHPIAGIQIIVDKEKSLQAVNIGGEPFNENQMYYVATSNYLASGGDSMVFFKNGTDIIETDYLIRNAILDHFKEVDTLKAAVDDRFMQLNN